MPIEVELPDGSIAEFPDGTPHEAIKSAIQRQLARPPKADFGNVQSGVASTEAAPAANNSPLAGLVTGKRPVSDPGYHSFNGNIGSGILHGLQRLLLGAGQSAVRGGPSAEVGRYISEKMGSGPNPMDYGAQLGDVIGGIAGDSRRDFENTTAGQTTEGKVGAVVGQYAPTLAIPMGGATLPARLAVATGGGAGSAYVANPVESGDYASQKAMDAGAGGLGGLAGQAVLGEGARLTGRVLGAATRPAGAMTRRGTEARAAQVIRQAANDPASLSRVAPSEIPGVNRTLAEQVLDPGVSRLERKYASELAGQREANNAARREAIRAEFHGADDSSINAIEMARDIEARRALRGLRSKTDVAIEPVVQGVDNLIARNRGRPQVQQALNYVKQQLESGIDNADQAYNVRKTIGDLMEGRLSGDLASATTAKGELAFVRALLDRQMRRAVPQWGAYLKGYRAASRVADQARVGKTLLTNGATRVENAATGEQNLTPDKFARLTQDPRVLVRTATGFPKGSAAALEPGQQRIIAQINDDLSRQHYAANAGRGPGSDTAQNLGTEAMLAEALGSTPIANMLGKVAVVGKVSEAMQRQSAARVNRLVQEMLADPERARQILAMIPPNQRPAIQAILNQANRPSVAAALSPLARPSDQSADR